AFFATGRALARDPRNTRALELRADAAEVAGRAQEAAEALQKRIELEGNDAQTTSWKLRLGRLYADLGQADKALPLLMPALDGLEPPVLLELAPGARLLPPEEGARVWRRLLDFFPEPQDPAPTRLQMAEWTGKLARALMALGQPDEAQKIFKRTVQLEPRDETALHHLAELSMDRFPEEAIAAHRSLLELEPPPLESLHKLAELFGVTGQPDAAFSAAAALVGLGHATPEERAIYDRIASKPPPVDLLKIAERPEVHAGGDAGAVRELLA